MISNLRISVAELIVWALLAAAGLTWISFRVVDGAAWLMDRLRDRVAPLLEDDDEEPDWIAEWWENAREVPPPLPPERTWEQMTSHQLPLADSKPPWPFGFPPEHPERFTILQAQRERRAPWWEAEHRAAYESLGFDYPSGLMARVREAAQ